MTEHTIARQGNRIEVAVAIFAGLLRNNGRVLWLLLHHKISRLWPSRASTSQGYNTTTHLLRDHATILGGMAITIEIIQDAVDGLNALLPADFRPEIGIIGGSGLSALEEAVEEPRWEVPYGKIKGFPVSTGK